MNQIQTTGIVLTRVNYGEADRIITLITPDHGKLRLMAKGVRRIKSKLAGGIELFSITNLSYIRGKGEIGTLVSTRLIKYHSNIVQNMERVQLGYELIKLLNKVTEDETESDYYDILQQSFEALDDSAIDIQLIRLWFSARLLGIGGNTPNLYTDSKDKELSSAKFYNFDADAMCFFEHPEGEYDASAVKFLRLLFAGNVPQVLERIEGISGLVEQMGPLILTMKLTYLHP